MVNHSPRRVHQDTQVHIAIAITIDQDDGVAFTTPQGIQIHAREPQVRGVMVEGVTTQDIPVSILSNRMETQGRSILLHIGPVPVFHVPGHTSYHQTSIRTHSTPNRRNRRVFPAWMLQTPVEHELVEPRVVRDRTYWWCPHHQRWVRHQPSHCRHQTMSNSC